MLKDLNNLKKEAETNIDKNFGKELTFTKENRLSLIKEYNNYFSPKWSAQLIDSSICIQSKDNLIAYLPFQWFGIIHSCNDFINALFEYVPHVDLLKDHVNSEELIRDLPKIDWTSSLSVENKEKINNFIDHTFPDSQSDKDNFSAFLNGTSWLDKKNENELTGKKLIRQPVDYISSAILIKSKLINDSSGKISQFIDLYINSKVVKNIIEELCFSDVALSEPTGKKGDNIIYYGAPGTGKSHTIDKEVEEENTVRTVFHAETTNSDFMGCLKPVMDCETIKYEFRPGPFTNAVINAIKDPGNHYWLVIEEINRAPAAAVFGEIFQLLDREPDTGKSRYSITLSDIDMQTYIKNNSEITLENGKLQLPGNLTLLATMNSSDQAVMPLDTAFKRRWQFRYIPLDFDLCPIGDLQFPDANGTTMEVSWKNFAVTINAILTEQGIPEDRHFGPFFLSENEISDNKKETMTGKLFMYLWDDVLRHGMKETVFNSDIKTYGQLIRYFDDKKTFSDDFYQKLELLTPHQAEVSEETETHDYEKSSDPS